MNISSGPKLYNNMNISSGPKLYFERGLEITVAIKDTTSQWEHRTKTQIAHKRTTEGILLHHQQSMFFYFNWSCNR